MRVLGDKIGSTLLAQTADVSTMPWNGDGLTANLDENGNIPEEQFDAACIHSEDEAVEAAERIGYPVMLKASEGGGGKGIRKALDEAELRTAYPQVLGEVPGSPVFLVKLCVGARHLEVQVVGDTHGNAIALGGRDCSTQRRFQKIFEEGPPIIAPDDKFEEMMRAAVRLCKNIGYCSAGTVEYLYIPETKDYYFLELNPRLQVEHPVTEGITGVSLPATQLHVAMGIPLNNIPEVRTFYGGDAKAVGDINLDYFKPSSEYPKHVIAARITAENPDEGFKPTSGKIERINFQSDTKVWGYFSVVADGGVHEFADSQFGHLFATGDTREEARKALVLALKELFIMGEIRTTVEYLGELLEMDDFKENTIDTAWLDGLIASKSVGVEVEPQSAVINAAVYRGYKQVQDAVRNFKESLEKGQLSTLPLRELQGLPVEITYLDTKYTFSVTPKAPDVFLLQQGEQEIEVRTREQADGSLYVAYGAETHQLYAKEEALGLRMILDGVTVLLPTVYDPSELRSDVTGKLVRYLVDDGAQIEAGQPYAEAEAMKMLIAIKADESGTVKHEKQPGSIINQGDLLASLALKDPSKVKKIVNYEGALSYQQTSLSDETTLQAFRSSQKALELVMDGYVMDAEPLVQKMLSMLSSVGLALGEIQDAASALGNKLPTALDTQIQAACAKTKAEHVDGEDTKENMVLVATLRGMIGDYANSLPEVKKGELLVVVAPVVAVLDKFGAGLRENAISVVCALLQRFMATETKFAGTADDQAIAAMLKQTPDDKEAIFNAAFAHEQLPLRSALCISLLRQLFTFPERFGVEPLRTLPPALDVVVQMSSLPGAPYKELALTAAQFGLYKAEKPFDEVVAELKTDLLASGPESAAASRSLVVNALLALFPDTEVGQTAMQVALKRFYRSYKLLDMSTSERGTTTLTEFSYESADKAQDDTKSPVRYGQLAVVPELGALSTALPELLENYKGQGPGPINVLHLAVNMPISEGAGAEEELIAAVQQMLQGQRAALEAKANAQHKTHSSHMSHFPMLFPHNITRLGPFPPHVTLCRVVPTGYHTAPLVSVQGVRLVSLMLPNPPKWPRQFSFTLARNFEEDRERRNMYPTMWNLLEMDRLKEWAPERLQAISHNSVVLLGQQGTRPRVQQRIFCRGITHSSGLDDPASAESAFLKSLDELQLAMLDKRVLPSASSHLFMHVLTPFAAAPAELIGTFKELMSELISKHATRLLKLSVDEIEVRVHTELPSGERQAVRLMASSMSGQWLKTEGFLEYLDPVTGLTTSYCTIDDDALCFLEPYPIASALANKRAVARRIGTTYAYDFLGLIEKGVVGAWQEALAMGASQAMPSNLLEADELLLSAEGTLSPGSRVVGTNTVGMVGWHMTIKTPEYPQGRPVVVVANDCTVQSGSFGVAEDDFFDAVSKYARKLGVPRVHIASNSGARIGLAEELKPYFNVAWTDSANTALGYEYLYLDEADVGRFADETFHGEWVTVNGEKRFKLNDIVGEKDGIGVENLRGSGMIAGETSKAYEETFTLSYVTGRSVGIGAYINRLAHRVIQMSNGPIILTGFSALNKLLGKEVYNSQDQLGGPQIMLPNGVSHQLADDDQDGVEKILKWLSYVPITACAPPSVITCVDPIERAIGFLPTKAPYDPRHMLAGATAPDGSWTSGFFDQGSFTEYLAEWGKSVVIGRARRGGGALGGIAGATRLVEQRIPADPANPNSREAVLAQAGQVWYPDSAFKTAQAIQDFNHAENLPLIIFANWRGFSGGTRDMFGEILKFGSYIVDNLRDYKHPVFAYIPPNGELRGGAWVVIDPTINADMMEMYADTNARGGILEPPGICDVKFRKPDLVKTMHRLDEKLQQLTSELAVAEESLAEDEAQSLRQQIAQREATLIPLYTQISHEFADLHDRPGRMYAKGVIRDVVPWEGAREYFSWRVRRRLAQDALVKQLKAVDETLEHQAAVALLRSWSNDIDWEDDKAALGWFEKEGAAIEANLSKVRLEAIKTMMKDMMASLSAENKAELLKEL